MRQTRPAWVCLICGFCSSGQDCASSFFQIPLTVDTLAFGLWLGPSPSIADFHRRERAACRAHHIKKGLPRLRQPQWWEMVDSNHRSRQTTDLQSAPIGRSGNLPCSVVMRVSGLIRFVSGCFLNRINYDTGGVSFCQPPYLRACLRAAVQLFP